MKLTALCFCYRSIMSQLILRFVCEAPVSRWSQEQCWLGHQSVKVLTMLDRTKDGNWSSRLERWVCGQSSRPVKRKLITETSKRSQQLMPRNREMPQHTCILPGCESLQEHPGWNLHWSPSRCLRVAWWWNVRALFVSSKDGAAQHHYTLFGFAFTVIKFCPGRFLSNSKLSQKLSSTKLECFAWMNLKE